MSAGAALVTCGSLFVDGSVGERGDTAVTYMAAISGELPGSRGPGGAQVRCGCGQPRTARRRDESGCPGRTWPIALACMSGFGLWRWRPDAASRWQPLLRILEIPWLSPDFAWPGAQVHDVRYGSSMATANLVIGLVSAAAAIAAAVFAYWAIRPADDPRTAEAGLPHGSSWLRSSA
jgi:hypothetical protein